MKKVNSICIITIAVFCAVSLLLIIYNALTYKEYYSCPEPYHYIWERLQIETFWRGTWSGNKYGSPYEVSIRIPRTAHNKIADFKPEAFVIWNNGQEFSVPVAKMKRFEGKSGVTFTYKWINMDLSQSNQVNYKLVMAESGIRYETKISASVKNEVKRRNKLFWLLEL